MKELVTLMQILTTDPKFDSYEVAREYNAILIQSQIQLQTNIINITKSIEDI